MSQQREPDRFRGLFGAASAAQEAGDPAKAKKYYARLVKIAGKGDARPELVAGLDVVSPDPPERPPKQLRRPVAFAGSHRSGGERRADQGDRRIGVGGDQQLRQVRPIAHALTLPPGLA